MTTTTAWLAAFGALIPVAAAAQTVAPAPTSPPTAREVVEKQLEARATRPPGITGAEAKRIRDRYLESIGRTIETDRIAATSVAR